MLIILCPLGIVRHLNAVPLPKHVVFNEVLANPSGSESTDEMVELYYSTEAVENIDLSGWVLGEPGEDSNDEILDFTGLHDIGETGTILSPGMFALLVDPGYAGMLNSDILGNNSTTSFLMLTIDQDSTLGNGLSNSGDTIFISTAIGAPEQFRFEWIADAGNGTSWERIDPSFVALSETSSVNWEKSLAGNGHSLGAHNSVLKIGSGGDDLEGRIVGLITEFWGSGTSGQSPDYVELFITQASGTVLGVQLREGNSVAITLPDLVPQKNDYIVIEFDGDPTILPITPRRVFGNRVWFLSTTDTSLINTDNTLIIQNADGTIVDSVIYADKKGTWSSTTNQEVVRVVNSTDTLNILATARDRRHWIVDEGFSQNLVVEDINDDFENQSVENPASTNLSGQRRRDVQNQPVDTNSTADWDTGVPTKGRGFGGAGFITPATLEVFQSPFSPFGDGRFLEAVISYNVPSGSFVTIQIFDVQGRLVRTLKADELTNGATQIVRWSGRNINESIVPVGIYIVHMEAQQKDTGVSVRDSKTVIVGRKL